MRLLGVLALVAPVMVGILFISDPELTASWVDDGYRSNVAAVTAVAIGVALTSLICWTIVRIRYGRLVQAAERIADGDYTVAVPESGGGIESRLGAAINRISASLADTHDRATIDRLTGVANRQVLLAALFAEVERASRYERPLCVAFVDIDHFKAVNDSHGHARGDSVLRELAHRVQEQIREVDTFARYGGEEFVVVLPETTVEGAAQLADRICVAVRREPFRHDGEEPLDISVSIGGAAFPDHGSSPATLMRAADKALYVAKAEGRDRWHMPGV